jgi:uncharacterized membrane protein YsdA (DUF1294 family)/cold shock CspA family protein
MRSKGRITSWNDEKGFGFITPLAGGKRIFVHINAFRNRDRRPEIGQVVTYATSSDKQGRPCAAQATLAGDRLAQNRKSPGESVSIILAAIFSIFIVLAFFTSKIPAIIPIIYLAVSIVTYVAYAFDKSAAKKGAWRTRESTLHILSLIGGWPGAVVAQTRLRHKSKKESFRAAFWMTVFINCGMFVWLLTPTGAVTLQSFITNVISG